MINFRLIRHLYLFSVVAKEGNISKASQKLGISQPPLTEHIKTLEHHLGVELFHRSKNGVKLTSTGQRILPKVEQFIAAMHTLEQDIDDVLVGINKTIHIGAITQSMTQVLPKLITSYKQIDPHTKIYVQEIHSADAISSLEYGKIDLAVVRSVNYDSSLPIASLPVLDDVLCAVLPKSHPLSQHSSLFLSALAKENFVMHRRSISPASFDEVMMACRLAGFEPKIRAKTHSAITQIAMAGCSDLIALSPQSLASMTKDCIFVPLLDNHGNPIIITAIVLLCRQDDKYVQSFFNMVKQLISTHTNFLTNL